MRYVDIQTGEWRNLDTNLPSGVTASIEALYQLDESANWLKDRSSAGRDLTLVGANAPTLYRAHGLTGRAFWDDTGGHFLQTAVDASLVSAIGAMTVEMILIALGFTADDDSLFYIGGDPASETEANNILFDLRAYGTNELRANRLDVFHERGLGTNERGESDVSLPMGGMVHLAITRAADGVTHQVFQQGVLRDTFVMANPATGGTNSTLSVGGYNIASTCDYAIFSVRLFFAKLTAAQILESYQYLTALSKFTWDGYEMLGRERR
jgi:hypothetical protein